MMLRGLAVALLVFGGFAGAGTVTPTAAPVSAAAQDRLVYWVHPAGQTCPIWYYYTDGDSALPSIIARCEKATGKTCVKARGTAAPAC